MSADNTRVLLVLPQDVLDRARVMAGKATIAFKLPVSVQIVLRALLAEGLKRARHPSLLANIEGQAQAVRRIRSLAGQGGASRRSGEPPGFETSRRPAGREDQRRGI